MASKRKRPKTMNISKRGNAFPLIAAAALVLGLLLWQRVKPSAPPPALQEWTSQNNPKVIPLAGQVMMLGMNTHVRLESQQADKVHLRLMQGDMRIQQRQPIISVETEHFKVLPLGNQFGVATSKQRSYVKVFEGQATVVEKGSGKSTPLGANQSLQIPPPPPIAQTPSKKKQ